MIAFIVCEQSVAIILKLLDNFSVSRSKFSGLTNYLIFATNNTTHLKRISIHFDVSIK